MGLKTKKREGAMVLFPSLNWFESRLFIRISSFDFAVVHLRCVRQLCSSQAEVSLVQIGCQLLEGGGGEGGMGRGSFPWLR